MNLDKLLKFIDVTGDMFLEDCARKDKGRADYKIAAMMGNFYKNYASEAHAKDPKEIKKEMKYFIGDLGEMLFAESRKLPELDKFFVSRGSMSVSEFLMIYKGRMKKIMKRGKIRNEDEAIAVNGLLSDMDTELSDEDRRTLTEILDQYERSIA